MNEERRMILEMLKEGSITIEEAERLMEAIPGQQSQHLAAAYAITPNRLRVRVTEDGKAKVNVKIPFSLVRAGLKLGKTFGAIGIKREKDGEGHEEVVEMLRSLDIDELLSSLNDGEITLPYTMVDIDDEENNQQVLVVLE